MCGSIGAEHYYGEIVWYEGNKRCDIELERELSLKDATALNKKDAGRFMRWKPGMMSGRFDSESDVIARAITVFKDKFPDGLLFRGDNCVASAQPVIYWSERLTKVAKRINELSAELDVIQYNEKLESVNFRKFQKLMKHV